MSNQLKAAEFLRKAANALDSSRCDSDIEPPTRPPESLSQAVRNIFTPYSVRQASSGRSGSRSRTRTSAGPVSYWSHRFCLLSCSTQESAPTREEKQILFDAGLGEKKITFLKDSCPESFQSKLEEVFPKLTGCGGFELLRSNIGSRVALELLKMPPNGFTSNYLANESNLGQAMCYIRPIQRNISTLIDCAQDYAESSERVEECLKCNKMVKVSALRSHVQSCNDPEKEKEDVDLSLPKRRKITPICEYVCERD